MPGLAGQPVVAAVVAWRLCAGVPARKAAELRRLGVRPEAGVGVNPAYSMLGVVLIAWPAVRWWRTRGEPG